MDTAIYVCCESWRELLPPGVQTPEQEEDLAVRRWDLLALTPQGLPAGGEVRCLLLLAPGECAQLEGVRSERVVTYGLSPRDSLTLSSLAEPVLCVQRALPRPDGTVIEPQEFPLPALPAPAQELLPLLGLRLLQMPLEKAFSL